MDYRYVTLLASCCICDVRFVVDLALVYFATASATAISQRTSYLMGFCCCLISCIFIGSLDSGFRRLKTPGLNRQAQARSCTSSESLCSAQHPFSDIAKWTLPSAHRGQCTSSGIRNPRRLPAKMPFKMTLQAEHEPSLSTRDPSLTHCNSKVPIGLDRVRRT